MRARIRGRKMMKALPVAAAGFCAALTLSVGSAAVAQSPAEPPDHVEACTNDAWKAMAREDGTGFKNFGQCVSHVARGGSVHFSVPHACTAEGGTYSRTGPNLTGNLFGRSIIWVC